MVEFYSPSGISWRKLIHFYTIEFTIHCALSWFASVRHSAHTKIHNGSLTLSLYMRATVHFGLLPQDFSLLMMFCCPGCQVSIAGSLQSSWYYSSMRFNSSLLYFWLLLQFGYKFSSNPWYFYHGNRGKYRELIESWAHLCFQEEHTVINNQSLLPLWDLQLWGEMPLVSSRQDLWVDPETKPLSVRCL